MREKLKMARPYVRALIKDEKAREHALTALTEARLVQRRLQGDKLREALVRLADDKKTQAHLREFSKELSSVGRRVHRRRRGRWLVVLLAGSSIVFLVNPVTGGRLRRLLSSTFDRSDGSASDQLSRVATSIEVDVPVSTAYAHWAKWDAAITEPRPDQPSVNGAQTSPFVTFEPLGSDRTKIAVQIDAPGADDLQTRGDLERFKKLVENGGTTRPARAAKKPRAAAPRRSRAKSSPSK